MGYTISLDDEIKNFFGETELGQRMQMFNLAVDEQDIDYIVDIPEDNLLFDYGIRQIEYRFGGDCKKYYEGIKKIPLKHQLYGDLRLLKIPDRRSVQIDVESYSVIIKWGEGKYTEFKNEPVSHYYSIDYQIDMQNEKFSSDYMVAFTDYKRFLSVIHSGAKLKGVCGIYYFDILELSAENMIKYMDLCFTLQGKHFGESYNIHESILVFECNSIDDKSYQLVLKKLNTIIKYMIYLVNEKKWKCDLFDRVLVKCNNVRWIDEYGNIQMSQGIGGKDFLRIVEILRLYGFKVGDTFDFK